MFQFEFAANSSYVFVSRDLSGNNFSGSIPLTLGDLEHLLIL